MKTLGRYALTLLIASVLIETGRALLAGQGLVGPVAGVLAFAWIGWIGVIAGIPLLIVFLWFLPAALDRWPNAWPPVVGAVLSGAIWGVTAFALGGLALLTGTMAPGGTLPEKVVGVLTFVSVGAAVGFVEGLSWRARGVST